MKIKILIYILLISLNCIIGSEHGIYLLTNTRINSDIAEIESNIITELEKNNFRILDSKAITTPDHVRENEEEHCGFNAHLIAFTSDEYIKMLTSFGSKYLVAGFFKISIYETPEGININITDPETVNRIIFNDLYETEDFEKYDDIVEKTRDFKTKIINSLHSSGGGEPVEIAMEPIRDDEDLAESSRDMFMMVGPLTLFNDEDQFPLIYSIENKEGFKGLEKVRNNIFENIENFVPEEDDIEYRWYPDSSDLKWRIIAEIISPKNDAILIGITRPRTEAVSLHIAGSSREEDGNLCPGIDHAAAYPIEILLIQENDKVNIYTQREMHRMDMYFWDAGMSAFMNHMSMPGILDESIKKALLGKKIIEE